MEVVLAPLSAASVEKRKKLVFALWICLGAASVAIFGTLGYGVWIGFQGGTGASVDDKVLSLSLLGFPVGSVLLRWCSEAIATHADQYKPLQLGDCSEMKDLADQHPSLALYLRAINAEGRPVLGCDLELARLWVRDLKNECHRQACRAINGLC